MDSDLKVAGDDSFIYGANSFVSPWKLGDGEYSMSMNTTNRGGIITTRPGARSCIFDEDISGTNVQGITLFVPSSGVASLVFMVDGLVYSSPYPFRTFSQIEGLKFSPYSKFASWASTVQSTTYTSDGVLDTLPTPKNVLMIQDGYTRAGYWDGANAGHLDPTPSHSEFTIEGKDGTPVGLWMKWSNNRLWVSRRNIVFASDIGNPLKFHDATFLAEGRRFILPGDCTGMAETPDQMGVLCFTAESVTVFQSAIQDRTAWLSTPGFQRIALPTIGCTAPRSIVQQHGLIWWMTPAGLIGLDDAARLNISSKLSVEDQEMAVSKANVDRNITGVCGSFFENYLFHAVPNGHKINTRLHVLDQAPGGSANVNSWPSYWEGMFRPVEFARGILHGKERVFTISRDTDSIIRIWELFRKDKTDNGMPITSWVQTKTHLYDSREFKRFQFAEIEALGISGETSFMIAAKGMKGAFQKVGTKEVVATNGQVYYDSTYGEYRGSSTQLRFISTKQGGSDPTECNTDCVEDDRHCGLIDKGFCLKIFWSGIAGISAYRMFSLFEPREVIGACEEDETGPRLLTEGGCSELAITSEKTPFEEFTGEGEFAGYGGVTETAQATSIISQADADRKAEKAARWVVMRESGEMVF